MFSDSEFKSCFGAMQTGLENQTCKQYQFSFLFKAHKEMLPDWLSLKWEDIF